MFIDEIAKTYLISKDEVLKLLKADGIEPIFGIPFREVGYITSKQFELVKNDLLKIENRRLQDSVDYYQKKSTKKEYKKRVQKKKPIAIRLQTAY